MARLAGFALSLALVVGGCGSSEPTDDERVDAALLRLSDFPADEDWAAEPITDDPELAQLEADLEQCDAQYDPTLAVKSADRDSDNYVRGDLIVVGSSAAVVRDESRRNSLFRALDILIDCAGAALEKALSQQAGHDMRVVVSAPYALDVSTGADRTAGRAIQVGVGSENFFIDLVVVEHGPTLLYGTFMHQGELDQSDEEGILAQAVKRLNDL